jgi:hypothetical protein
MRATHVLTASPFVLETQHEDASYKDVKPNVDLRATSGE